MKKHIEQTLKNRIEQVEFKLVAYDEAIKLLTPKIGTAPTKREFNKLVDAVKARTNLDIGSHIEDSMGKDWTIYVRSDSYSTRREVKFYGVQRWSTNILDAEKVEDWKRQKDNLLHGYEVYKSQLFNLVDILALLDEQELERKELEARQAREIATFEAQCKTTLDGFSYVLKEAEELEKKEKQDEYYRAREREFEERNGG